MRIDPAKTVISNVLEVPELKVKTGGDLTRYIHAENTVSGGNKVSFFHAQGGDVGYAEAVGVPSIVGNATPAKIGHLDFNAIGFNFNGPVLFTDVNTSVITGDSGVTEMPATIKIMDKP